jgi:hypothetical protein
VEEPVKRIKADFYGSRCFFPDAADGAFRSSKKIDETCAAFCYCAHRQLSVSFCKSCTKV